MIDHLVLRTPSSAKGGEFFYALALDVTHTMSQPASHDVEGTDQAGYWELVRDNVNLRRLWMGSVVSLLGDWPIPPPFTRKERR